MNRFDDEEEESDFIKRFYESGECPDCGETIPDDALSGEQCSNCGHVWSAIDEAL